MTEEQIRSTLVRKGLSGSDLEAGTAQLMERLNVDKPFINPQTRNEILIGTGADIALSLAKKTPAGALANLLRAFGSTVIGNVGGAVVTPESQKTLKNQSAADIAVRSGTESIFGAAAGNLIRAAGKAVPALKSALSKAKGIGAESAIPEGAVLDASKSNLAPEDLKTVVDALAKNPDIAAKVPSAALLPKSFGVATAKGRFTNIFSKTVDEALPAVDKRLEVLIGDLNPTSKFSAGLRRQVDARIKRVDAGVTKSFERAQLQDAVPFDEFKGRLLGAIKKATPASGTDIAVRQSKGLIELQQFILENTPAGTKVTRKGLNELISEFPGRADAKVLLKKNLSIGTDKAEKALAFKQLVAKGSTKIQAELSDEAIQSARALNRLVHNKKLANIGPLISGLEPRSISFLKGFGPETNKEIFRRIMSTRTKTPLQKGVNAPNADKIVEEKLLALIGNFRTKPKEFLSEVRGLSLVRGLLDNLNSSKGFNALSFPTLVLGGNTLRIIEKQFKIGKLPAALLAGGGFFATKKFLTSGVDFNKVVRTLDNVNIPVSTRTRVLSSFVRNLVISGTKQFQATKRDENKRPQPLTLR